MSKIHNPKVVTVSAGVTGIAPHDHDKECAVLGTVWTEPGQGATAGELWDEIRSAGRIPVDAKTEHAIAAHVIALATRGTSVPNWNLSTNLRLTGSPLTAEDIKRILEAK